jgi:hypothetical protein
MELDLKTRIALLQDVLKGAGAIEQIRAKLRSPFISCSAIAHLTRIGINSSNTPDR